MENMKAHARNCYCHLVSGGVGKMLKSMNRRGDVKKEKVFN